MTRDEIEAFAGLLAKSLQTDATLNVFIDDVMHDMAMRHAPHFVKTKIKAITSGTDTYAFEDNMIKIVYVFMYDEMISPCSEDALDAYSASQTTDTGTPTHIVFDSETARYYRLYPTPDFSSSPFLGGDPLGNGYPDDTLTLIYSDAREDDIPSPYALAIAFDALSREFVIPSDHTDTTFAAVCNDIAVLLYQLLGVE